MTVTGFGFSTSGVAPAGLGTPSLNAALYAPGFTQSNGGCVSSLNIDQASRDYTYDSYGNEEGMGDTGQRIYMCVRTLRGRRMNFQRFGLRVPETITDRVQTEIERYVRDACEPVTSDGSATITSVEVASQGTSALVIVRWTDNRSREERSTRVPLER